MDADDRTPPDSPVTSDQLRTGRAPQNDQGDRTGPSGSDASCWWKQADLRQPAELLRDSATLVTARRHLDGLLMVLAVDPFEPVAYYELGLYLAGPGPQALAAYDRIQAHIMRGL